MRSLFLLCFTLLQVNQLSAQLQIHGTITEQDGKTTIAFATVGLKNENTGVNADDKGTFQIDVASATDTLLVFCAGYIPVRIAVSTIALNTNLPIFLSRNTVSLQETQIVAKRSLHKQDILNEFKPSRIHRFINSTGYEVQLAQEFENPQKNSKLTQVILYLRDEIGQQTRFRLRIYEADTVGKPGADIYPDGILINYNNEVPLTISLMDKDIYIPTEKFFIAVEWLKIAGNENGYGTKSYRPVIGFSNKGSRDDHVWRLNYRNEWYQRDITIGKGNLAITAVVKY